jgi:hypothetical protein
MQVSEVKHKQHFIIHPYQKGSMNLNLLLEDGQISAAVFNKDNTQLYEVCRIAFNESNQHSQNLINELTFFLKDFDILKHTYAHVQIQLLNRLFTLVPKSFSNGNLKEILAFNLGLTDIKKIQQSLINNSINFVYTYDHDLHLFLEKTFNTAKIEHAGAVSADLFLKSAILKKSDVFLNIHDHVIELMVKKDSDLLFYNVFKWDSNEDILYFLLFSIEQFQLDQSTLLLSIAANLPTTHTLFELMKKYIRHIQFVSSKAIDVPVENLPNHYYFNLLNYHLCEL